MGTQGAAEYFASRLGAERALTSEESAMLERVIRRCVAEPRRMWTAAEDRALLRLSRSSPRRYAREFASRSGRTEWSVRSRLRKIKRSVTSG